MNQWLLRCMHGKAVGRELRGNVASVYLGALPREPDACTQVLLQQGARSWSVAARDARGASIRFCGHGALAAAQVALDRVALEQPEQPAGSLMFRNEAQQWTGWRDRSGMDAERVTLSFARPGLSPCTVPSAAGLWLGVDPTAAALSGAADDYLILEVASADCVRRAQPDPAAITAATQRALLLTALTATGPVFRYFAPQYGDVEDAATGSAAVQLGAYWRERAGLEDADYTQLSAAGGYMTVRCNTTEVELSARVEYLAA